MLTSIFENEKKFIKGRSSNERRLLASFFFWALSQPFLSVFINTYLWRDNPVPITLFFYSSGFFAGMIIGFFLNTRFFLRTLCVKRALILGILLQAVIPFLLIWLHLETILPTVFIGLLIGTGAGFYWANRNTLTSQATDKSKRNAYASIEFSLMTFAGVISPLLLGWFLGFSEHTELYSVQTAYTVSAWVSMGLLAISAYFLTKLTLGKECFNIKSLFVKQASRRWQWLRAFEFFDGMIYGAEAVIPLLLILYFLGKEGMVGTIGSATALLSGVLLYAIGRRIRDEIRVIQVWFLFSFIGVICIAAFFNPIAILFYYFLRGLTGSFKGSALQIILLDVVADQKNSDDSRRIQLLFDREVVLNFGRLAVLIPLIPLSYFYPDFVMRFGLFIVLFAQLGLVACAKKMKT
ncbi:MAG: MFS transporter [Patescibacteria group bacterium]